MSIDRNFKHYDGEPAAIVSNRKTVAQQLGASSDLPTKKRQVQLTPEEGGSSQKPPKKKASVGLQKRLSELKKKLDVAGAPVKDAKSVKDEEEIDDEEESSA